MEFDTDPGFPDHLPGSPSNPRPYSQCPKPHSQSYLAPPLRTSRDVVSIENLLSMPFADLIFKAQQIHRQHFAPNAVQLSTLLSIKTGGCPEDCGYCPQAARYH